MRTRIHSIVIVYRFAEEDGTMSNDVSHAIVGGGIDFSDESKCLSDDEAAERVRAILHRREDDDIPHES